MKRFVIGDDNAGKRLDRYLATAFPRCSKNLFHRLIRTRKIKINGVRVEFKQVLESGDAIDIYLPESFFEGLEGGSIPSIFSLNVRYEDGHVLVVQKPAGLIVHKGGDERGGVLQDEVAAYCMASAGEQPGRFPVSPVHRLDRNTEGLVMFGKSYAGFTLLTKLIREHRIRKRYLAVAVGEMNGKRRIMTKLRKDSEDNKVYVDYEEGLEAVTDVQPLAVRNGFTLACVEIKTGRTHQIRVSLAEIGHPVVGDGKYGERRLFSDFAEKFGVRNQLLLAWSLVFPDEEGIFDGGSAGLKGRKITALLPDQWIRIMAEWFGMNRRDLEKLV